MKKTNIARLSALALTLCLASTALMSGTMAKYTTTVTGDGTATVAKWSFQVNEKDSAQKFTVNLTDTSLNGKVTTGKIAPGTDGSFAIKLDANGSDTAVDYVITFSNFVNQPANLKFYSDAAFTNEITDLESNGITGTIALGSIGTVKIETIYWKWDYETLGVDDKVDTGDAGKDMSFTITVTGTQSDPTQTPAP